MTKRTTLLAAILFVAMPLSAALGAPLGSTWDDAKKLPDFFKGNWQSATWMLDKPTNTPYTAAAKKFIAHYKPIQDFPFAGADCRTPGMPIILRAGSPVKFFYEPGMIAIYIENDSMTRFIQLNVPHTARPNPTYLGQSVGHFEGDTLVVDTVGFVDDIILQYGVLPGHGMGPMVQIPDSIFGPHGPHLRMVERFRLRDPDTLEDRMTIYDDTVWTKPYVSPVQLFKRNHGSAGLPREWVCSAANDILTFDPKQNKTIVEDPAAELKKLEMQKPR